MSTGSHPTTDERAHLERGEALGRWLHRLFEHLAAWRAERKTRAELHRLSDQVLRDIGIERGQIDDVARAMARVVAAPPARPTAVIAPLPVPSAPEVATTADDDAQTLRPAA